MELHPNMIYIYIYPIAALPTFSGTDVTENQGTDVSVKFTMDTSTGPMKTCAARQRQTGGLLGLEHPGIGSGLSTQFFDAWLSRPRQKMTHS